jgi:L-ascorbate metabolism protein UlaG (beta-lactamase superfamily)
VPVVQPNFLPTRETSELRATWLGHACFLVEFTNGLRVLFDPVFSHRCSPSQWVGPARFTKAPCKIEDIPIIDVVCISHNHYDHLDVATIKAIVKNHPNTHFIVPLGNRKWFLDTGIPNVTEFDWWEEGDLELSPVADSKDSKLESLTAKFGCLPCQHIANRGLFDRGATLWASWSVESGGKKVYFAG